MVHDSDFFGFGDYVELKRLDEVRTNHFRINLVGVIGPGCETTTLRLLKRRFTFTGQGFTWDNDGRHVDRRIKALGLEEGTFAGVTGTKLTTKNLTDAENELDETEEKRFQRAADL